MRISDWSSDVCSSDLLAIGPDGKLYCCNNGGFNYVESNGYLAPHGIADDYSGGRIERIDIETGEVEVLYKSGDHGVTLRGPKENGRAAGGERVCQYVVIPGAGVSVKKKQH